MLDKLLHALTPLDVPDRRPLSPDEIDPEEPDPDAEGDRVVYDEMDRQEDQRGS